MLIIDGHDNGINRDLLELLVLILSVIIVTINRIIFHFLVIGPWLWSIALEHERSRSF
jgi:hypothetical protein